MTIIGEGSRIELDFTGLYSNFLDSKGGSILSGHLHNQNNRLTIIRQGSLAITF